MRMQYMYLVFATFAKIFLLYRHLSFPYLNSVATFNTDAKVNIDPVF